MRAVTLSWTSDEGRQEVMADITDEALISLIPALEFIDGDEEATSIRDGL